LKHLHADAEPFIHGKEGLDDLQLHPMVRIAVMLLADTDEIGSAESVDQLPEGDLAPGVGIINDQGVRFREEGERGAGSSALATVGLAEVANPRTTTAVNSIRIFFSKNMAGYNPAPHFYRIRGSENGLPRMVCHAIRWSAIRIRAICWSAWR